MIFEIADDQINLLNDADLRTLVGKLCEEELRVHGFSTAAVTRGGNQDAEDGGVDVRVSLPDDSRISGYVPAVNTCFQSKAQDMPRKKILEEMAPEGILRESIAELASMNGAYIIVSSKGSLADTSLKNRKDAMIAAINEKIPANSLIVDFYDRHRIATWVNQYSTLIPWVREKTGDPLKDWRPFGDWSSSPTSSDSPYFLDDSVRLFSASLKDANGLKAIEGVNASDDKAEAKLGIELLNTMLGCGPFSSRYSFEFGARARDFGRYPRQKTDFLDWFSPTIRTALAMGVSDRPIAPAVRSVLASHFSEICRTIGILEELMKAAEEFNGKFGWPEGWIGVRSALSKGKAQFDESQLAKLDILSQKIKPSNLADIVRAYAFSMEWGSLDIAETEEDEKTDIGKVQERIFDLCVDLGRQLALDQDQLDSLIIETLTSDSQKTYALGKGIASGCLLLRECWSTLVDKFLVLSERERRPNVLFGFLNGACLRDPGETKTLLDSIASDSRMHPFLVKCNLNAEMSDKGVERLISGLTLETVPVSSYKDLAYSRAIVGFNDEQFRDLIQSIITKNGGLSVAIEIIGMQLHQAQSDNLPQRERFKAAGRDLLEQYHFERNQDSDYLLGNIILVSLDKPEHEELARRLCTKLLDAVMNFSVHPWEIRHIVEALMKIFPLAVLDILVEQNEANKQINTRSAFAFVGNNKDCPFQALSEQVWTEWAEGKPQTRYVQLAKVVKFSNTIDDKKSSIWSPIAEKIINTAPNPVKVLNVFFYRFQPAMGWSGSLASILESRRSLIDVLKHHPKPEIAIWAKEHSLKLEDWIKKEREQASQWNKERDEKFE